jgi:hypothetical protein
VHIKRLILDGVPLAVADRHALQRALEAELTRLLTDHGLGPTLQAGGSLAAVKTHNIQLTTHRRPDHFGRQIAQAVHSGLSR